MSSHHVIREHQEPALLLWENEAVSMEVIGQLLEWSPVVGVHYRTLGVLLNEGIKVDIVFCEPYDVERLKEYLIGQEPVKIVGISKMALSDALTILKKEGAMAINLLAQPEKEHLYQIEFFASKLKTVLYTQDESWVLIKNKYEKWVPTGTKVTLISTNGTLISTQGMQRDLHHEVISQEKELVTHKEGIFSVAVHEGNCWLVEKLS